jgi:putative hydrolase of the HAD superfamily
MQQTDKKYIFDLDGTLYSFAGPKHATFTESSFYTNLKERILVYIATTLQVDRARSEEIFTHVNKEFNGELSIGFEKAYGIDRYAFYEATWNCLPGDYITVDPRLAVALAPFRGHALLLTAAPHVWASKVLQHLEIADIFGENIITGEPDIRKPDPAVFHLAAKQLNVHPKHIVSIGDQNYSDILPAKSLGMTTILIGPKLLDAHHQAASIYDALNIIKEKSL